MPEHALQRQANLLDLDPVIGLLKHDLATTPHHQPVALEPELRDRSLRLRLEVLDRAHDDASPSNTTIRISRCDVEHEEAARVATCSRHLGSPPMRSKYSVILTFLAACSPPGTPSDGGIATTSYTRDVQPLVERSCVSCHQTGGIAPFALDSYAAVQPMAATMWDAIDNKRMPPFFASADCNSYEGDLRFSAEEKALFKKWVGGGAPKGTDEESVHAIIPAPPTIRRDVTMGFGDPYDVRIEGKTDNYRCYLLDPQNTGDQLVAGFELVADNVPVIHHMLAYAVDAADVKTIQDLDDADQGSGYGCSQGNLGLAKVIQNQVASWVPGASATKMPSGTGLVLKAGAKIIMQIHYNTAALYRGGKTTDQSKLALEFAPTGSLTTATILPMLDHNLNIKANDAKSVQVATLPSKFYAPQGATIYRAMGHMHQLGTSVKSEIVHADGTSQCLLNVEEWDFNWQRDYTLKTPITVKPGDSLRITCTYDNSQQNQAYLNGVQNTPRDVAWGESSFDEMCMTYMTFTKL